MDKHTIRMPDIGEGIAEVEIVEWHVGVGDQVVEDQVLADVMTDKASVEIPSPITGRVVSLGGNVGDILAVGSDLITLTPDGASPSSPSSAGQTSAAATVRPPHAVSTLQADADKAASSDKATAQPTQTMSDSSKKVLASPSVRQRARQLDINLHDVASSEGDTPVSHRDLDEFLLSRYSSEHRTASAPRSSLQSDGVGGTEYDDVTRPDTQINVVGLRRQIALKMHESKRQIPHFSYVEEIDVTDVEKLRLTLNENLDSEQDRLTMLPFIVRAMVLAVQRFPEINARYDSENGVITQFGAVHMGIATQTENGLMVPVLRDAQSLDVWECASRIKQLAATTRRGKAQRTELTGSTLTLSSLGSLGGIMATPIINHPEVAIVGVNRIVDRPTLQDGVLVSRKMMNLSSSFDHRVVDGMNAAQFIHEVKRLLESPALLFMRGSS